jgi:hypothetical protein
MLGIIVVTTTTHDERLYIHCHSYTVSLSNSLIPKAARRVPIRIPKEQTSNAKCDGIHAELGGGVDAEAPLAAAAAAAAHGA